jgi:elongation factor Ts
MADINANMVRELRERSGLPMMDCKQALTEVGGDMNAAMELLRKRGKAAAEKKVGRATGDGRIGKYRDDKVAALAEVLCETAPVANNPMFRELADNIAHVAAASGQTDSRAILDAKAPATGQSVQELLHDAVNKLRENIQIGRIVRATGRTGSYVHHNGRVAVLLTVEGSGGDDTLLSEICMHITFAQPQAVSRDQISAELVEQEKTVARELIVASGKPANLVDKILQGKMDRWFSERVLLEQAFVKDDKKTVGQVLKDAGVTITGFTRLQVGET